MDQDLGRTKSGQSHQDDTRKIQGCVCVHVRGYYLTLRCVFQRDHSAVWGKKSLNSFLVLNCGSGLWATEALRTFK